MSYQLETIFHSKKNTEETSSLHMILGHLHQLVEICHGMSNSSNFYSASGGAPIFME